jgi:hypothetical protein
MKIGIVREGKVPPDKRVPFTPHQCLEIKEKFSAVELTVQSSEVRAFKDQEYRSLGIDVQDSLEHCDVIFGVKEVPLDMLIPEKKYFFFSHTYKEQPYNRKLLRAILDKRIQLIDYEVLKYKSGGRILGFGRYAGIVGAYNGLRCWGEKFGSFTLKPAHMCNDRVEMESYLSEVQFPEGFKLLLTGNGRVGGGAVEIMDELGIHKVSPEEYLTKEFKEPVYTQIDADLYNKRKDGQPFEKKHFYANPSAYDSDFFRFAKVTNLYMACHYWHHEAPQILTQAQLASDESSIQVISDISCDIKEPIASTLRPSTIAKPFYGYDPRTGAEVALDAPGSIGVQAVDNLPCELPKDASKGFGAKLIEEILPCLLGNDPDEVIWRGSETDLEGNLTPHFAYLKDYVNS